MKMCICIATEYLENNELANSLFGFSTTSYRKPWTNFLANPIFHVYFSIIFLTLEIDTVTPYLGVAFRAYFSSLQLTFIQMKLYLKSQGNTLKLKSYF